MVDCIYELDHVNRAGVKHLVSLGHGCVSDELCTMKRELRSLLRNAEYLNTRADSTAQLFAEGLALKDQRITQELASLSQEQNQIMCAMTRMTVRDSASSRLTKVVVEE